MAVSLPKINITFTQLAGSFIQRSARGVAILILRDATESNGNFFQFLDATQVEGAPFTDENRQYIRDALSFGPLRVSVAKVGANGTLADALAIVTGNEKTGWITVADATEQDCTDLCSWVKSQEMKDKSWKAVVYKANDPDCMHLVNLKNEKVTFVDKRGETSGAKYTPSLAGLFAACNVAHGSTNKRCPNLSHVEIPADPDAVVGTGGFLLVNDDDEVCVGVDVNSLTTTDGKNRTEDMKYIETVEAMDLMRDDIRDTYHREYQGNRNKLANQMIFIAAVNEYFRQLGDADVLDELHDNRAFIDVEAQRAAWVGSGKAEAAKWDDATVRNNTFKRQIFLAGTVKVLGSMVDLTFGVNLV